MSPQIILEHFPENLDKTIRLPASKSISNRLLILDYLCDSAFKLSNLSNADDTRLLQQLLHTITQKETNEIYCKNAGTVLRFLLSVLSIKEGNWILSGDERMQERPVKDLVDALLQFGADIKHLSKEGFPPLQIKGKQLEGGAIEINPRLSSQFVSSLLLIAPVLPKGLSLKLKGTPSSKPYIDMTLALLKKCGISVIWKNDIVKVLHGKIKPLEYKIENDWSAASYFYAATALGKSYTFRMDNLYTNTLQGDGQILPKLFEQLGVKTTFNQNGIIISKTTKDITPFFSFNFSDNPDLAQTFAVCSAALGIEAHLSGLASLSIKETDRLQALCIELRKMDVLTVVENESLWLKPSLLKINQAIETYNDHRMAMAFAPLACRYPKIIINNPQVVEKSFPDFWNEFCLDNGMKNRMLNS